MQDFEIYGRTMQLGWGQKDLEVEVLNDGDPRSYKSELQSVEQHTLVRFDCIIYLKGCLFLHFLDQQAYYLMLISTHHELLLIILFLFLFHPEKIVKKKNKGNIVCDTVYLDAKDASPK